MSAVSESGPLHTQCGSARNTWLLSCWDLAPQRLWLLCVHQTANNSIQYIPVLRQIPVGVLVAGSLARPSRPFPGRNGLKAHFSHAEWMCPQTGGAHL